MKDLVRRQGKVIGNAAQVKDGMTIGNDLPQEKETTEVVQGKISLSYWSKWTF